ncbi:MAG: biotin-dependent carboxyltransferase family protein [Firmicutes bacterium]|nr:biotin-dependent carboxyltransferase family protein [Bacillota bacterium]MCL5038252.1 biotin-dependent carboxyltransferase family protein [Bacillota bacterium]
MGKVRIISAGGLSTVQDLGRYGYQRFGLSPAGAVDDFSLRVGNLLLGNDPGAAALEMTGLGPTAEFLEDTLFALTGGDLGPSLDGVDLPLWEVLFATRGSVLSFAGLRRGLRGYLSVAGGFDVPEVLGSRSTDLTAGLGGWEGRALRSGDTLTTFPAVRPSGIVGRRLHPSRLPHFASPYTLRVVLGPQQAFFTAEAVETFLLSSYEVTPQLDRVGIKFKGPTLAHAGSTDLISEGNPLGALQVPKGGLPILLLASRHTVGGYPKVAVVTGSDLYQAGQMKPGDIVTFQAVTLQEAHQLWRSYIASFGKLRAILG